MGLAAFDDKANCAKAIFTLQNPALKDYLLDVAIPDTMPGFEQLPYRY